MPCWEVRTMSVEFQAKHRGLLEKALNVLGYTWSYSSTSTTVVSGLVVPGLGMINLEKGTAEIDRRNQSKLNSLKQEYSKQALRRAAKLQGWQMKTKGQKGVLKR